MSYLSFIPHYIEIDWFIVYNGVVCEEVNGFYDFNWIMARLFRQCEHKYYIVLCHFSCCVLKYSNKHGVDIDMV